MHILWCLLVCNILNLSLWWAPVEVSNQCARVLTYEVYSEIKVSIAIIKDSSEESVFMQYAHFTLRVLEYMADNLFHSRVIDQPHLSHMTLVTLHIRFSSLTPAHHHLNAMMHLLHQVRSPEPEPSWIEQERFNKVRSPICFKSWGDPAG